MKTLNQLLIVLFLLFCANNLLGQVDLSSGLIGHWPLDGNATDVSGNNRNGQILGNLTAVPDRFGNANKAYRFDGAGSYIRVNDDVGINPEKFSISVWFQSTSDRVQTIIGKTKFNAEPRNEQLQLYINWPLTPGIGSVLVPRGAPCNLGHQFAESRIFTGAPLCRQRWYHMVVSFDGVEHKLYLDGELKSRRVTGFSQTTSCRGDYQFGSWWSGDLQYFEGFMDDIRIYSRALNDTEIALLGERQTDKQRYDFSYLQNICNPLEVNFFYNGPGTNVSWQFEPNKTGNGKRPVHLFSKKDQFPVSMIVKYDNCLTNDTLTKNLNLEFENANLIMSSDTVICKGSSFKLKTNIPDDFCWVENSSISDIYDAEPTVAPISDTVFYVNHKREGNNLVVNGDFSNGNSGFSSTYLNRSNNTTEGEYFIGNNPRNWNSALSACVQPNGTTGNMMLVNGVPEPNKVVWQQEVTVQANKTYDFSLFITALFPVNPSLLQFAINGIIIGDSIAANAVPCTWQKFNAIWNSASNTKAIISIVNRNTEVQGNDFAIDDIAFREIIYETDSIAVRVETGKIQITADTSICKNSSIQLSASGANNYSWFPASGLNNTNIANPIATIDTTITFKLTAQTLTGCILEAKVQITAKELPFGKLNPTEISICGTDSIEMLAEGGVKYLWTPGKFFNDSTIANPKAGVDTSTVLNVQIFGGNGCSVLDSVKVNWKNTFAFDITPKTGSICPGDSIELIASGGNEYLWDIPIINNNLNKPRVFVSPDVDTEFKVLIKNTNCEDSIVLSSIITLNPFPDLEILKSNDIDCYTPTTQLTASGAEVYNWDQTTDLSDLSISNPIANPKEPTTFRLFATSDKGCVSRDSIFVDFVKNGIVEIEGDTISCKNTLVQLKAAGAETYSWLPVVGLDNPAISNPLANIISNIQYRVSGITLAGCVVEDSIAIRILETPPINLFPADPTVCGLDTLQLFAQGGLTYQWSPAINLNNPNISNPIATVRSSITYNIKVTHQNGCIELDSLSIKWRESPEFDISPKNGLICKGDSIQITASGGDIFLWKPALGLNNLETPSILVRPTETMTFQVLVINNECRDSAEMNAVIRINPPPSLILSKSGDLSCEVANVQIFASGASSYLWEPSTGLSNPNISNPTVRVSTSTLFRVTGIDSIGCTSTDTISVNFFNTGILTLYQLPTAFTPNGDGLNDCFGISKWGGGINLEQFLIFNRWGQQVFSGNAARICWDGTINGIMQPSGNYIYQLKASTNCGRIERKGAFLLVR